MCLPILDNLRFLIVNFIVFGSIADYGQIRFNDVLDNWNFIYIEPYIYKTNILKRAIHDFHHSKEINIYFEIPFKKWWFNQYYDEKYANGKEKLCFIFEEYSKLPRNKEFIIYLKRKYPQAKFVFSFSNIIHDMNRLNYYKKHFDMIITFDKGDAEKYSIKYFPSYYSKIDIDRVVDTKSDIFFVGKNKERLSIILHVFEKFNQNGIVCDFNISEVNELDKKYESDIIYNRYLSYLNVLEKVNETNCILEVLKDGQTGTSLRSLEAIAYGKKLLTNNGTVINEPWYNPDFVSVFSNAEDIDLEFVRNSNVNIDYNYIQEISPKKLLQFIEDQFQN